MSIKKEERESLKKEIIRQIGEKEVLFVPSVFAKEKGISSTTVKRYLDELLATGKICTTMLAKRKRYALASKESRFVLPIDGIKEDVVWREHVKPLMEGVPKIAYENSEYAFTEMLNNVIDHSEGSKVFISVKNNGYRVEFIIQDNGVGIFGKIAASLNLEEKRFAILELAKGKFTTDPDSHTGEGIFFSSKAVDSFAIISDGLFFLGPTSNDSPYVDDTAVGKNGTFVIFDILHDHDESIFNLFNRFTQYPDDYGFTKTTVPVRLLEYGDDDPLVVSRSQAKRLIVRFERFEHIILDFSGIREIGQGFADELFRVFVKAHPNTELTAINCTEKVLAMIHHVQAAEE